MKKFFQSGSEEESISGNFQEKKLNKPAEKISENWNEGKRDFEGRGNLPYRSTSPEHSSSEH